MNDGAQDADRVGEAIRRACSISPGRVRIESEETAEADPFVRPCELTCV